MHLIAPAKINLNLRMVGKRADGYHLLQSVVAFTQLADEITIEPANDLTLEINGPFAAGVPVEGNLVLRVARLLYATKGAKITLTKNIPVGAGLGGGSADAACTLKALNQYWRLELPESKLMQIAATIGSDVSVCMQPQTQWMVETGSRVTPMDFKPPWWVVLAYPHRLLEAKNVYAAMNPPYSQAQAMPSYKTDAQWLEYLQGEKNDLMEPAVSLCPPAGEILTFMANLPQLEFARMSGSGSACFAVFTGESNALHATMLLQKHFPHYWIHLTQFI